jgi:hypothetical protein
MNIDDDGGAGWEVGHIIKGLIAFDLAGSSDYLLGSIADLTG